MTQALSHRTTGAFCRVRRFFTASLPLIAMTMITACGGSGSTSTTAPTLSSISVTPTTMSVAVGVTDQLAATAVYSDGSKQDVSGSVTWASSNLRVVTINASGLASSLAAGSTMISATLSGVSGSATLTVTTATLVSIGVTPAMPSLAVGSTQQFTATGAYTDNSKHDLTTMVTWMSANSAVASISNSTDSYGLATTLVPGNTLVTAALNGITSPAVTLTVTPATLVSIAVTPVNLSIAAGTTQQFTATGTYTDHSTQVLTGAVTWTSSNTTFASISNAAGSNGVATTLASGSTGVTATLNGITSPAVTLTVTPATLISIAITPASPSIAAGTTQQFTAMGTYTDNSTQNLTTAATWSSSNTAVASVNNANGSNGLATSLQTGQVSITAQVGSVTSTPVTLTVTAATLLSLGVTPAMPSIAAGSTQQFTATGVYTDNSTHDLTTIVTWTSSNTAVASISNAGGSNGLATTLAHGATSVTATLNGITSPTVTLTVTPAILVSIAVTPTTASIAVGTTLQFTVTGTYTDNSSQNLTTSVTWSSSNTAVASISNASGSNGLATGLQIGQVSISAQVGSVTSTPVTLTVTQATLVSIAVTPANPSIAAGTTQQFTATGTYTDQSTQNLTVSATWTSANTAVASISNASGSNGLATGLEIGQVSITAQAGSVTSTPVTLTVTQAALVSIAVTPTMPSAMIGDILQFTATGTYTDSSTQNLTTAATWISSNTSVAMISNASGSNGLATPLTGGSTQITASSGSVASPAVTLQVVVATYTVLHSFTGGPDGQYPQYGAMIQGSDGNFYGTTQVGGTSNLGTVFKLTPAGVETVLYNFAGGSDGQNPYGSLMQGSDGNFYGTTDAGGTSNEGTVFKLTPAGVETVLYSFAGGSDGANPLAGLIQGSDGNFYGTTVNGGTSNLGTAFKLTPAGVKTVLHTFGAGSDSAEPYTGLIQGSDGNFYGTTLYGGPSNSGTVFKLTPAGVETVLHNFTGSASGFYPIGALIQGSDGNFYGITENGGTNNLGTVFRLTQTGVEAVLYSFAGGSDGEAPMGGLIQGSDGNFYGTTIYGGTSNVGTVFRLTPAGVETVLHMFTGAGDGADPLAPLVQGSDGHFYGTTSGRGTSTLGTLFKY